MISWNQIPYQVDILDLNAISDSFKVIINQQKVLFPLKYCGRVPKLRFKEFDVVWIVKDVNSILKIGSGKDYKHLDIGNIPVYGTGGILNKVDKYLFKGESVCIGRKGTIDNPFYLNEKFWTVDTLFYTHSFSGGIPKFVYYLFQRINWYKYNEASGVPSLSKMTILRIPLFLPTLQEQTKIANFLSIVDKRIEKIENKKKLLERYKKGLMQKIFSQKIRFKNDNGNDFPDWVEKKLGEVGQTFNGLIGKSKKDFGKGKLYIQYKQVFDNSKIDINNFGLVNVCDNENQRMVCVGDVFFTTSSETAGEVGYSSVLLDKVDNVYLNSFCFGYRLNSFEKFNPNFAQYIFRNNLFRKKVIRLSQGSTRYNMSKIELMKILINLPSLPEQTKIANSLSIVDKKIELINKQIEATRKYKKGLLQQMFV